MNEPVNTVQYFDKPPDLLPSGILKLICGEEYKLMSNVIKTEGRKYKRIERWEAVKTDA